MTDAMRRDDATERQITAADPARSTWLTANAGSGKTRVLTNRVARLLLEGTAPERILCLTYTKAAATEMQNRLLGTLGEWAMLDDAPLRAALDHLGAASAGDLSAARRLFAQAIETPGGLKVQTIHSFCASLLRRFPLEAGVPHGFEEMDDRSAIQLRADILEEMARDDLPEMADLTSINSGAKIDALLSQLGGPFDAGDLARIDEMAGGDDLGQVLRGVFGGLEPGLVPALIAAMAGGSDSEQKTAARLQAGDWEAPALRELELLESICLFGKGAKAPYGAKIGSFPNKPTREGPAAPIMAQLDDLMRAVEDARPRRIAVEFAARAAALLRFALAFSERYRARKAAHGWLDFDDLIRYAGALLSDSAMAQWVLFRLDGGIDHILVDEAQDTSPGQWAVVRALAAEFTAGESDRQRTLFVVGDPKQSIYSFQGADIAVFDEMRAKFGDDFAAVRAPMQALDLEFSFRSSPAILRAVDATFEGEAASGLGQAALHRAFFAQMPGRVDFWPVIEDPEKPETGRWTDPVDQLAADSAPTRLAEAIAAQIRQMLDANTAIPTRDGARPMTPGDIIILVQGRQREIFPEILRALKAADLPVAGADRLRLASELAVQDIRAMLDFLDTQEDDLSLAELLRSPLIGLSEDDLYRLAHGRGRKTLWEALRESHHIDAKALLSDMIAHSNLRPYDLISRLMIRHKGRENLLARLGAEAEDGIDELLSQALSYEASGPPSLTGFLVWLSADDVQISRQPGSGEGLIRLMTVHGAKGLESPVVILPDTANRDPRGPGEIMRAPGAPPLLTGAAEGRPDFAQALYDEVVARNEDERKRLLYVAMTRAESWLIVAAAGKTGNDRDWHSLVGEGLARSGLDVAEMDGPAGRMLRYSHGDWPEPVLREPDGDAEGERAEIPAWVDELPPAMALPAAPIAATALGGVKALPGAEGDDPAAAMLFGTRLHLLLEALDPAQPDSWADHARNVLAGAEGGLPPEEETAALLDEVGAIFTAEDLRDIISASPGASVLNEVALTCSLPAIGQISGVIDRLIVTDTQITAIDYKTNRTVPARPEDTPLGIARQMAAYRAGLREIWPDRELRLLILWTHSREIMALPDAVLDRALAGLDPAAPAP
ncbi:MAG: double-strand break repair helicase AddA [Paracoccus sp. (in: a-proteobacteria)]|nr:double-strand break repair helicase AddA [Paracoccus sp. (in: a-proteobacteria)]